MPAADGPGARGDAQAESLVAIEAGDITPGARRRLRELRDSGAAFTSDLSTADFALCHQLGLRPLAQVMGSSIYQMGYQGLGWGAGSYARAYQAGGGVVAEMDTLSYAYNEARSRALVRLKHEATAVGADAVVGVDVRIQARDYGEAAASNVIEYSVVGTAVARKSDALRGPATQQRSPVLTELGVADYTKLVSAGIEPAGIVGASSAFFSTYSYAFGGGVFGGSAMGMTQANFELTGFTQAIYAARAQAMGAIHQQAQQLGASGIVGVRIDRDMRRQAMGGSNQAGLLVVLHVMGTAIHDSLASLPPVPETTINLSL
jgi:uncharacterized protein YbjQ (UPF0145 family)